MFEELFQHIEQITDDYRTVEKFERKFPFTNQHSYGPGWKAIPIKYNHKFSALSRKIPFTSDLFKDDSINTAVFAVLYPFTFVHPNDNMYSEDQTIFHVPVISPQGDIGIKLEKYQHIQKWTPGQIISHRGDDMYCAWNFTNLKRVKLHITV